MKNKDKYILVAFPYPSGSGLHIGHAYSYGLMDSYCRYLRYRGDNVFQPFGFDTHGLPTELYAQKVKRNVLDVANENIENFKSQLSIMNTSYDFKLSTSDESYVKWTQWLFTKLKEHGLAYKKNGSVNWCPSCKTVLSKEQLKEESCERCSTKTENKVMNQWYFKITDYKERLIKNLDWIDYPKPTINAQRKWLENLHDWCVSRQRKFGAKIPIEGEEDTIDTFVDSSFYFVRYCDPNNENELCSKDKYKQVDLYCTGSELSTNHLIYARFIHMFLYDIGVVPTEEPFKKLIHNGMILGCDGTKMSKSKGNVINPDDYDSDELRFHLMFIGHYFDGGTWSDQNISGIKRFINRFKEWMSREGEDVIDIEPFKSKVFNYTESFKFNKVVSEFMTLVNQNRTKNITPEIKKELIDIIKIYMPSFNIIQNN
jgi:leucyl-tRNA synthetase